MNNYVQPGRTLSLTAPRALASGEGFIVGALFAVATNAAASGAAVEGATDGVFDLTSDTGTAYATGDKVYWDDTAHRITKTATSNTLVGCAVAAKLSATTTARVKLNGTVS